VAPLECVVSSSDFYKCSVSLKSAVALYSIVKLCWIDENFLFEWYQLCCVEFEMSIEKHKDFHCFCSIIMSSVYIY
jgi:hypothetical protein